MTSPVVPYSLKDKPAFIERLLPVQKLSSEAFKEQMAVHGKTLTALGSYWRGRKPLILNKACILGCLLPITDNPTEDLEIFDMLMAMDEESFVVRLSHRPKPKDIVKALPIQNILEYFTIEPPGVLPESSPIDWSNSAYCNVKVSWRKDVDEFKRRHLEARMLPQVPYNKRVEKAKRPEEVRGSVHDHIWNHVNKHLGTCAYSFPDLIEQLGIMRYGHRPRIADTFCGSGQIPFEAARLGCDIYASDINPIACMLTWGDLHIVGGSPASLEKLIQDQHKLVDQLREEIDRLGIETDGQGWRAKVYLYCVEARCPQSGWMVPLLTTRIISDYYRTVADLIPDYDNKRYDISIRTGVSESEMKLAETGTVGRDTKYREAYMIHQVDGVVYKTKISTLRGDYTKPDGTIGNRLRLWESADFIPRPDDLLQERLYCIQWMRPKREGTGEEYEFRSITEDDIRRENIVQEYVKHHLSEWQANGWIPNMRIEVGGPPRYQGLDLVRSRGWTHWQHLFNPRQLLIGAFLNQRADARLVYGLTQVLNNNCRCSRWHHGSGGGGATVGIFDNQALNTLFNYGCRGSAYVASFLSQSYKNFPIPDTSRLQVAQIPADQLNEDCDIYITDPPYGDAVKYEEILDFFIAWLRKNPPLEFADWIWDSRRSLAIKGEDENFRRSMVAAYKRMTEYMPDNGIQVIMFTHQDGSIWADMANIVWASGLQVTAAWYVVTETDSALREGSYVKGTVLLVCRKRQGINKTTRDDLAWEIQEEVESQVKALIGLNQQAKGLYREENVFEDADIQMAGYAAALRVLTRYAIIDGRDMTAEAIRPRIKGETTFVDSLIAFAVNTSNQCLVPKGIEKYHWDKLSGAERFYLTMIDQESRGVKKLDNYQNFAKAFKVNNVRALMSSEHANDARLKSAIEFNRAEMSEGSELHHSVLRAVLYALMEVEKNVDIKEVLTHLTLNIPNYYGDLTQLELVVDLSNYLAIHLEGIRPEEASAARILREHVKSQKLG